MTLKFSEKVRRMRLVQRLQAVAMIDGSIKELRAINANLAVAGVEPAARIESLLGVLDLLTSDMDALERHLEHVIDTYEIQMVAAERGVDA